MSTKIHGEKHKARLLVVDDHALIREGLKHVIGLQTDMELCGEAYTCQGALEETSSKKPDLMILDLLGSGNGLELIKVLRSKFPSLRMLVVSQLDELVYAERTIRAGAHGFVMKKQSIAEILNAIRSVLAGELYVGSRLAAIAFNKMLGKRPASEKPRNRGIENLTDRELQIFHLLGAELSARKISRELNLSVKTVETHRENIKHKLGFQSAADLAEHAFKWIQRHNQPTVSKSDI
jgi:DNA-binding NarL/FixJ family response regulator